jgi:putative ABC transport system permease protein
MTASVRIHPGENPTAAMLDGRRSMAIPEVIWLRAADPARGRKIGIRKAVGASVRQIVVLLTDMARLVVLAALLAWPLAYWGLERWLSAYAYRVELGPAAFLTGGVALLGIALAAVASQALRAARSNPVEALRHE